MNTQETKKLYEDGLASGASGEAGAFIPPDLHVQRLSIAGKIIAGCSPRSLLDVGCGRGLLLNYIPEEGMGYYGIDIVPALISMARKQFPNASFKLGEISDVTQMYEMVACLGVLSHVTPDEMPEFVQSIAQRSSDMVLLEVQHPAIYRSGRFHAHDPDQVAAVLKAAGFNQVLVYLPYVLKESAYHILARL